MPRPILMTIAAFALAACNPGRHTPPVPSGVELHQPPPPFSADADRAAAMQQLLENFQRVHFDVDSSRLSDNAKTALTANAALLRSHSDLQVEVQGHADERGTVDYNLALGQRRARQVTDWLKTQGVSGTRLRTITFGEELPLVDGTDERTWSKNRRAEFRVIVAGTTP